MASRLRSPVKSVSKLSADSPLAEAIKSMLFGLGDSSKPLLTTAKMIETVLLQQMTIFLVQVEEIAMRRDSSKIEMQDIVFLMRNDKAKLTRLLNFINFKDTKGRCKTGVVTANGHIKMKLSKRIYDCLQFLKAIGITGVCDPSADDDLTSKERLVRIQN
ncbi:SAGA complex subunit spt3 isoform X3 [Nilaparvata lugens]|uniref:SAGA complex subunit spt3 isoform X3 n=1 Tax=Nilaparvata lugens TaxID=108931 RepID=UPI000B98E9C0|nr:SAGA complex subunit spt3 isoform X3 [Nilaparvata lugens]